MPLVQLGSLGPATGCTQARGVQGSEFEKLVVAGKSLSKPFLEVPLPKTDFGGAKQAQSAACT
jgi:hypothetical protein